MEARDCGAPRQGWGARDPWSLKKGRYPEGEAMTGTREEGGRGRGRDSSPDLLTKATRAEQKVLSSQALIAAPSRLHMERMELSRVTSRPRYQSTTRRVLVCAREETSVTRFPLPRREVQDTLYRRLHPPS